MTTPDHPTRSPSPIDQQRQALQPLVHAVRALTAAVSRGFEAIKPVELEPVESIAVAAYPYQDGDVTVLGPEVIASAEGSVISWKGRNYQLVPDGEIAPSPQRSAVAADQAAARCCVCRAAIENHTAGTGRPFCQDCADCGCNLDPCIRSAAPPLEPETETELREQIASVIRDSHSSPEALAWRQQYPHVIPAYVYADAVVPEVRHVLGAWHQAHERANAAEAKATAAHAQLRRLKAAVEENRRRHQQALDHAAQEHARAERAEELVAVRQDGTDTDAAEMKRAEQEIRSLYRERADLLALLAAHYPAVIIPAPDTDDGGDVDGGGWALLFLDLPTGQASWYIAPRDHDLIQHVEVVGHEDPRAQWDGHLTEEKYDRIRDYTRMLATGLPLAERHADLERRAQLAAEAAGRTAAAVIEAVPPLRRALEQLPATCRYHGDQLTAAHYSRGEGCCDTGIPALRRWRAAEALEKLNALKEF